MDSPPTVPGGKHPVVPQVEPAGQQYLPCPLPWQQTGAVGGQHPPPALFGQQVAPLPQQVSVSAQQLGSFFGQQPSALRQQTGFFLLQQPPLRFVRDFLQQVAFLGQYPPMPALTLLQRVAATQVVPWQTWVEVQHALPQGLAHGSFFASMPGPASAAPVASPAASAPKPPASKPRLGARRLIDAARRRVRVSNVDPSIAGARPPEAGLACPALARNGTGRQPIVNALPQSPTQATTGM
jgi:hypothetical protein